jgi:Xaa-Pro aminopeptidase
MTWPRDDAKLARARSLMAEQDLDALVVRAPDNIVYLTNYWCMKGFDAAIFPREGEPTLLVMEPQEETARRTAWTEDVRPFAGYDPADPRAPTARTLDLAVATLRERDLSGRIGLELTLGTQAADRMAGEPTTYTHDFFHAFDGVAREIVDATGLLSGARAIKTAQEIERMRLANELAALALEHTRETMRPGMKESEVAGIFESFVYGLGTGYKGAELARAFAIVWSGPGIRTFTSTGDRPIQEHEPTLFEIWICVDGYWCDLTKNLCPGELDARYVSLLELLLETMAAGADHLRDGASMAELDRMMRGRLADGGYPGQPSHPVAHGVGARAHEPPWPHQAGSGTIHNGMVLAIEPGAYWEGGGGLRLEDNFLVTNGGAEKLCSFPDDFRN